MYLWLPQTLLKAPVLAILTYILALKASLPQFLLLSTKKHKECQKARKTHFEVTKQRSEPDSGVTRILELSGGEFKIIVVNMLTVLWESWTT